MPPTPAAPAGTPRGQADPACSPVQWVILHCLGLILVLWDTPLPRTLERCCWLRAGSCRRPCGEIQGLEVHFGVKLEHKREAGVKHRSPCKLKHPKSHCTQHLQRAQPRRHPAGPDGSPWAQGTGGAGDEGHPEKGSSKAQLPAAWPLLPTRCHWRCWGTFSTLLKGDKAHC